MGALADRWHVIFKSLSERRRHGLPESIGPMDSNVLFILDGVGGFQFAPLMIRRAIRSFEAPLGTVVYRWQFGLTGEIWSDLMCFRRNRVMAARLARKLRTFRREHPTARLHLFGYSGGAGIAVMACGFLRTCGRRAATNEAATARERLVDGIRPLPGGCNPETQTPEDLPRRDEEAPPLIDTLILAAPALSPDYNLAPALRNVRRCIAWVSLRDRCLLGWGTQLFGTIDRRHCCAAGMVGFRIPPNATSEDRALYDRLEQVRWTPELRTKGPSGGHIGWLSEPFLHEQIGCLVADAGIQPEPQALACAKH